MERRTIHPTSNQSADIEEPFILCQKDTTRKVFLANIARKPGSNESKIRGRIVHQRKGKNAEWEDVRDLNLSNLHAGECASFELNSEAVDSFVKALRTLFQIAKTRGIPYRTTELVVGDKSQVTEITEENHRKVINSLLSRNYGREFWDALDTVDPDLASTLSYSRVQRDRERVLSEFENQLSVLNWQEHDWEQFFDKNEWIFGYGLSYKFLGLLRRQANYGGVDYTGRGAQQGDFLMKTEGSQKFTVLVEIKKPQTRFFTSDDYRNGVPVMTKDFVGAVSQVQVNARTWDKEGSERPVDRQLSQNRINTMSPRALLIVGRTDELDDLGKLNAFELFRRNLANPEIMTFDELFERTKYIVARTDQGSVDAS